MCVKQCLFSILATLLSASCAIGQEISTEPPNRVVGELSAHRQGGWEVGTEALFVVPRFESNPAFFVTARNINPSLQPAPQPPINSQTVEEFDYDMSYAPRLWVSFTAESGIGGRVRWCRFDRDANELQVVNPVLPLGSTTLFQSISSTSPLMAISPSTALPGVNSIQTQGVPGNNDQLSFRSNLSIEMWDVDGTFSGLGTEQWSFELFGGLRFAKIRQGYTANSVGTIPQFLTSAQSYEGVGPTIGLNGRRRFGGTGISAYGVGRITFLFGEDEHVSSGLNIGLIPDFTYAFHDNRSSRERILPVIDIEMGVEGTQPIGDLEAFARVGVFSQLLPLGSGANGNGNAGFIGINAGAGFRF